MNFRSVTEIFCLLDSSTPTRKAYLFETNSENWVFHCFTYWTRFQGLIANLLWKKKIWNCKWLIINIWSNEIWVLGYFILFYFWLIWSWIVYLFYFQVWLYFEVSEILIENLRYCWVLGFWLQVLGVWISCLSENSSFRIVIRE